MPAPRRALALALVLPVAAALVATDDFRAFLREHGRVYAPGSQEYALRKAIFDQNVARIAAHNAQAGRTWTAGLSTLADRTEAELARLRGYTPRATRAGSSGDSSRLSLLSRHGTVAKELNTSRPEDFTWAGILTVFDKAQDQSSCGSCWAIAADAALRAHMQLYHTDQTFSLEQLVSCTPNPHHCGGDGGCKGATVELALLYAAEVGVIPEDAWPYSGGEEECPKELIMTPENATKLRRGQTQHLTGVRKLAENGFGELMAAVLQGPVPVSIFADQRWMMYSTGILDACEKDAVINHGVVLVGYGGHVLRRYWHIYNSWGSTWGEGGFLRLQRHEDAEEADYCGWDDKPKDGTACDGAPAKVWVCGSCGILYDSVVPVVSPSANSLWVKNGGNLARMAAARAPKRELSVQERLLWEAAVR